jgi:hypothetical protein
MFKMSKQIKITVLASLLFGLFGYAEIVIDLSGGTGFDTGVRGQPTYRSMNQADYVNLFRITEGSSARGLAGGLDADTYDWRDHDSGSGWGDRGANFTTLEYLRMCRDYNAWPVLTANVFGGGYLLDDGTWQCELDNWNVSAAQLAADWVRYTNIILQNYRQGDTITDSEDLRVLNSISDWSGRNKLLLPGEASTPKVMYWEIGNEPEVGYAGGLMSNHYMTPTQYAQRYKTISQAMRAVDPDIKTGPCLVSPESQSGGKYYLDEIFKDPQSQVDFVAYHPYYSQIQTAWPNQANITAALVNYKDWLAYGADQTRNRAANYNRTVELMATEYNPLIWNASYEQYNSQAMALGVIESVFGFIEHDVKAAHFWEQAQARYSANHMFEILTEYLGDTLTASYPDDTDQTWRLYVTKNGSTGKVAIWGLNFDTVESKTLTLNLQNLSYSPSYLLKQHYGNWDGATSLTDYGVDLGWKDLSYMEDFDLSSLNIELPPAEVSFYSLETGDVPALPGDPNHFMVSSAKVYFDFEGLWYGDGELTSPCWKNKGTVSTGEGPSMVNIAAGTEGPYPRVTDIPPQGGIKGQALDLSHASAGGSLNAYYWGGRGSSTTVLENALTASKSLTLTYWLYRIDTGDSTYESVFWTPELLVYDLDHWAKFYVQDYYSSGTLGHDARDKWLFCALSIDTTTDTDNIKIYTGTKDESVGLTKVYSASLAKLNDTWRGFYFTFGSVHPSNGNQALKGYLDEVRIYASQRDNSAFLDFENIQKIYSADMMTDCQAVQDAGFGIESDLNGDCEVNFLDFVLLAENWLNCNNPHDVNCTRNW